MYENMRNAKTPEEYAMAYKPLQSIKSSEEIEEQRKKLSKDHLEYTYNEKLLANLETRINSLECKNKILEDTWIKHFESKIKFLEDNAFADRAKRIELENKVEELEKHVSTK